MFLPEPLPSVQRLGPVEHPGFFEAFKLGSKGGGVKFAPCSPRCRGGGRLGAPHWVLTFSSLLSAAGDTVPCQAKSPLSWLELLLARSWRPPDGTWAGRGQVRPGVPLPGEGWAVHPRHPRAPAAPAPGACEDVYPWLSPLSASLSLILSPSPLLSLSLSVTHPCPHPSSHPCAHPSSIPCPFPCPHPHPQPCPNPCSQPLPSLSCTVSRAKCSG